MTDTEFQLWAIYKAPIIRLDAICQEQFGVSPKTAYDQAEMNKLPIPTFRLADSRKAPRLVKLVDLARHIDNKAEAASEMWEASQV